jgi:uncharacterized protein (DUF3084 family)
MSNLVGCDFECQRNENIQKLRESYNSELKKYYDTYVKYIQYKFETGKDRAYKNNYAESTLKPMINKINIRLNNILSSLKTNIKETDLTIEDHERNINNKTDLIHKRNNVISQQDKQIANSNDEIVSRNRQIEFTEERNRYRLIMIILLVLVNLVLGGGLYYLLSGRK